MANHFAIFQVKGELDQILCGLSETLEVLELFRTATAVMRSLLVPSKNPPLSAESMFDMFHIHYSLHGSNAREQEEAVGLHLFNFLQCIKG